ncbi:MAG: 2-oxoacid:ferredoxin oxidoreductase subunit beta, partial [Bacteroidota bacterium]|nr:2-oxoacid:ferredoxin oxidoreductase subunit beta [Bacteroidota bacterium]
LKSVEKVFPELGYKKENYCVISGIGCSSRFPYYMDTYGIHGIHGRAAAISTGVKLANPELSVWMITGDGDSLAIGGNHFIHIIRRNIDINMLLFNNQIYGLTKGQYSPTTPKGRITKTSPNGTIEHPFNPGELVIGAKGKFFARTLDSNPKSMRKVMKEAAEHDGASVVEILQNCVIFNDKTHELITSKETRDDNQIHIEHGEPMLFGKNKEKGLRINANNKVEVVEIGKEGVSIDDILVHDKKNPDSSLHLKLANMYPPEFPAVFGVIRAVKAETYDDQLVSQIKEQKEISNIHCMDDLLNSGDTWDM